MGAIHRRRLFELAGAAGLVVVAGGPGSALAAGSGRWGDPRTWGGRIPGRGDVARIRGRVVLDRDVRVGGVVIEPGGQLVFNPRRPLTLRSRGNVVVRGRLTMRPAEAASNHRLVFEGIDERRFRGGGHRVLTTDVGLWVMGRGKLDLLGAPKSGWTRAAGAIGAGRAEIELETEPVGWRTGDEVVIAPTGPPGDPAHRAVHVARVTSVSGRTVNLDRPTEREHPAVTSASGRTFTAEVANVTRNVRIEGTRTGRAHIFVFARGEQSIRFVAVRHVGPRESRGSFSRAVLGRYAIHFHHCYEGSRGSIVEGTVVRDCGNHCFVPHTSHGVTFRDCVTLSAVESPYWWDEGDVTDDVLWENCLAAVVEPDDQTVSHDVTGFFLGRGTGNVARGCAAVAVGGRLNASGFQWPPEPANGVWTFEDCTAHNNAANGIFVWQLNHDDNLIDRFAGYRNGRAGVEHGSFKNTFAYSDSILLENAETQVRLHASSGATDGLGFSGLSLEGGPSGVEIVAHAVATPDPVRIADCHFVGQSDAAVLLSEQGTQAGSKQDFVRCTIGPDARDLEPGDFRVRFMSPATQTRVQRQDRTAYRLEADGDGIPIPPFAD